MLSSSRHLVRSLEITSRLHSEHARIWIGLTPAGSAARHVTPANAKGRETPPPATAPATRRQRCVLPRCQGHGCSDRPRAYLGDTPPRHYRLHPRPKLDVRAYDLDRLECSLPTRGRRGQRTGAPLAGQRLHVGLRRHPAGLEHRCGHVVHGLPPIVERHPKPDRSPRLCNRNVPPASTHIYPILCSELRK